MPTRNRWIVLYAASLTVLTVYPELANSQVVVTLPASSGKLKVTAEVPGVSPNTQGSGGVKISPIHNVYNAAHQVVSEQVTVTIPIPKNSDDIGEANAVAGALQQAFGTVVGRDPKNPTMPTVILPAGSVYVVADNAAGDNKINVAVIGGIAANFNIFQFDWESTLSGVDVNGNPSVFNASFGYDGLIDNASVNASQLPSLTLGALTAAMFAQLDANLPNALQADLTIDSRDYGLTFQIPDGSIDAFMNTSTTDTAAAVTGGLNDVQLVPEPTTWAMALAGIGALGIVMRARRRPLGAGAEA